MYLLFDIGGTKMRLATSKDGRQLAKTLIVSTPKKFSEGIKLFTNTSLRLTEGKKIKAIAGGIAGVFDQERAKLVASPNLADWVKKPLKKQLETKLKAPVFLENDAALAGLGEAIAGAGKGKKIVAYLTISTGIGGAKIVNGEIDKKAIGFEPGHQIVNASAKFADLEAQISGGALAKRCKKHPAKISDKKIWQEVNTYLAYGLHNLIVFWSPDIIVLGGGMMKNPAININHLHQCLNKTLKCFPQIPPIKKATLKDLSGLYGALHFLKQSLF